MDTTRPASRILSLLEILQDRPGISGPELAERLDVSTRTVRRYIVTLQDMGIPVEPNAGRSGGYALRPGFRLPPLMFSADEAIGLAMALLTIPANRHSGLPAPVGQALAKIERVLPNDLRDGVAAIRSQVSLPEYADWDTPGFPQPAVLAALAQARLGRHRVWFRYGRPTGDESAREVDPYGIGNVNGRWYLHGYCHLRQDRRTFRIDRIRRVDVLPQEFEMPADLNVIKAIQESLAMSWQNWMVEIELDCPIDEAREEIPPTFAILDELPDGRTRMRASTSNLGWFASRALALPWEMTIISPPELRIAARTHAERLLRAAKSDQ